MPHDNPFEPSAEPAGAARGGEGPPVPVALTPFAVLARCWAIFIAHPGIVAAAVLIPAIPGLGFVLIRLYLLSVGMNATDNGVQASMAALRLAVSAVSLLITVFFQLGTARLFLHLVRGTPARVGMLFEELALVPAAIGMTLMMGFLVCAGTLVFVIPGIVLALGLQFGTYVMVDRNWGALDSLEESWRLTKGHKLTLLGVAAVLSLFGIAASVLTLGWGAILVVPVLALSQAVLYQSLAQALRV